MWLCFLKFVWRCQSTGWELNSNAAAPSCQPESVRIKLKSDAIQSYNWQPASKAQVHDFSPTPLEKRNNPAMLIETGGKKFTTVCLEPNSVGWFIAQETATYVHQYWLVLWFWPQALSFRRLVAPVTFPMEKKQIKKKNNVIICEMLSTSASFIS